MHSNFQLILSVPPQQARSAAAHGLPLAHMAYRIGGGPHLFRSTPPIPLRGGLMSVDDGDFDGAGQPAPFCQEVIRECSARGFEGVVLDLESHPRPLLGRIIEELGGTIQVDSQLGRGAVFRVRLPLSAITGGKARNFLFFSTGEMAGKHRKGAMT